MVVHRDDLTSVHDLDPRIAHIETRAIANEDDVEVTFADSAQRTLHLWSGRTIGPHRIDDDARPSLVTLQQPS
jgi:hypothetical protein